MSIPPERPSPLVPGYRLDRYELLCPLAQGGMAAVWVARQTGKHGFTKLVAIKTILPQFSSDHRFRRMFLDEAHIASGIEHPNVAQILDLGEQHDVLYLVMEWVDGDALSRLQRAAEKKDLSVPPAIVLRVLADACGGLHAAHELRGRDGEPLNVVHRDVSPQNILISNKGVAKIIDFGIAKARDRVADDTNAGVLKGKIQYMAPEQAIGNPVDARADVWAIGAILYHLLSGKPPFDAPNQLAVLHRLSSGRAPLPLPESVPEPVAAVVGAALTHNPDLRVSSAQELQVALEDAMQKAGLRATSSDVASYMREHLAERIASRKRSVEVALSAAAERARVVSQLALPADSANGVIPATAVADLFGEAPPPPSEPATTHGLVAGSTGSIEMGSTPPARASLLAGRGRVVAAAAGAVVALVIVIAVATRRSPEPPPATSAATRASAKPIAAKPSVVAAATTETAPSIPVVEPDPPPVASTFASASPSPSVPTAPRIVGGKAVPTLTAHKPATTTTGTASATQKPGWKKIDDGF